MKQCIALVRTGSHFQKSVNLQLDAGNDTLIKTYIPTDSSVTVLDRYLSAVSGRSSERATVLTGPHGRGKSHFLLVLLSLLSGASEAGQELLSETERVEERMRRACLADCSGMDGIHVTKDVFKLWNSGRKYLSVPVSPVPGVNLNDVFITALSEALFREGAAGEDAAESIYPWGSVSLPLTGTDALSVYRQTGRILTEKCGYAGMFIVFDEFGRYLEGHSGEGFSGDMQTLQDLCDLAERSGQEIFLTLVANKSIYAYREGIAAAAKSAFCGVEGRLTEVEFVISEQNHYELAAGALIRQEPEFSWAYEALSGSGDYGRLLEESAGLSYFRRLFSREEFFQTAAKGCFPMVPLFPCALLRISERVAQSERTLFTFLSGDGRGGLKWILKNGLEELIGVDKIYDFFRGFFRGTADQPRIHSEWVRAEDALARVTDETERAVIKAVAVIRMMRRAEEFPAREDIIRPALGIGEEQCRVAIASLVGKELIIFRHSAGEYALRARAGADIECPVRKKMEEYGSRFRAAGVLEEVAEHKYELPVQYNRKYTMTRYFQYVFFETEDFLQLPDAGYLFEEAFADGKIIVLLRTEREESGSASESVLQKHLDLLNDARVLLLLPDRAYDDGGLCRKYRALRNLERDEKFIDGNWSLARELALYAEDTASEINTKLEKWYRSKQGRVRILAAGKPPVFRESGEAFEALLSRICMDYYSCAPRINLELLNIRNPGARYQRARDRVVKNLLGRADMSAYRRGTGPEAMIYRAVFVHTGSDEGFRKVSGEISRFIQGCAGKRRSFEILYSRLCGKDYGVRPGVMPLLVAGKLAEQEDIAVIYSGKRGMEPGAEVLSRINERPESYELYLECMTEEKEEYLERLEMLFSAGDSDMTEKQDRSAGICRRMQDWYRSLPQYARVTSAFATEDAAKISAFRAALRRIEVNPVELLFERFPQIAGAAGGGLCACGRASGGAVDICAGGYLKTAGEIGRLQTLLDGKLPELKRQIAESIRTVFGIGEDAGIKEFLQEWRQGQAAAAGKAVTGAAAGRFLKYIENPAADDEEETVGALSEIVSDLSPVDWRDGALEQFVSELSGIRDELEEAFSGRKNTRQCTSVIVQKADGRAVERYFEEKPAGQTGVYLKNMMTEVLEEFGEALSPSQKAAVLAQLLVEI